MYIYNLISVYTRSPEDERLIIEILEIFGDIDAARTALAEEKKRLIEVGFVSDKHPDHSFYEANMVERYEDRCRLTLNEEVAHLSIVMSRVNISIGVK